MEKCHVETSSEGKSKSGQRDDSSTLRRHFSRKKKHVDHKKARTLAAVVSALQTKKPGTVRRFLSSLPGVRTGRTFKGEPFGLVTPFWWGLRSN